MGHTEGLEVSWTAPPGPVDRYEVRHKRTTDGTWPPETDVDGGTSHVIGGLEVGLEYEVQVRAVSVYGTGEWAPAPAAVAGAAPGPPLGLTADDAGGQGISVGWRHPAERGSGVDGYRVEWTDIDPTTDPDAFAGAESHPLGPSATSYMIPIELLARDQVRGASVVPSVAPSRRGWLEALAKGEVHWVRVVAHNAAGEGVSQAADATPTSAPGPPAVSGIAPGDEQLTIDWQANADDGGTDVTGHVVQWSTDAAFSSPGQDSTVAAAARSHTVDGLANGTTYWVRVAAVNGTGQSGWSAEAATPSQTARQPTGVTVGADPGGRALDVAWTAPTQTSLTGYTVNWRTADGELHTDAGQQAGPAAATTADVDGLVADVTYHVRVEAHYPDGVSGSAATVSGAPTARQAALGGPTGVGVAADPAGRASAAAAPSDPVGVSVDWTPPAAGAGAPVLFTELQWKPDLAPSYSTDDRAKLEGSAPQAVAGFALGAAYDFRLRAWNLDGPGRWTSDPDGIVAYTPDPPAVTGVTAGRADGLGSGEIRVQWQAPAFHGGRAVSEYEVQWTATDPATEFIPLGTNTTAATGLTVSRLANGTRYWVRVSAANDVGAGDWSAVGSAVPSTVPDAPAITGVTGNDGQITVTWSAPGSGGSAITQYQVQWTATDPATEFIPLGTDTTAATGLAIGRLANGTRYWVRVSATNANGAGDWSPTGSAVPATVPDAPVIGSADRGDGQITVTWSAPDDGGSALSGYEVRYRTSSTSGSGAGAWQDWPHGGLATWAVISGLDNGTPYDVQVRAANETGHSDWSAMESAVPATVPGPLALDLLEPGDGEIDVSWSAPDDGGSAITQYQVQWTATDPTAGFTPSGEADTAALSHTIDDLDNGARHWVRVRAVNDVDPGPWSEIRSAMPESLVDQLRASINHIVESREAQWPWLRTAWDEISAADKEIEIADLGAIAAQVHPACETNVANTRLIECGTGGLSVDRTGYLDNSRANSDSDGPGRIIPEGSDFEGKMIHELGHVYTVTSDLLDSPADRGSLGRAWLYFLTADYTPRPNFQFVSELRCSLEVLADTLERLIAGPDGSYNNYRECFHPDGASDETITEMTTVVNSALGGNDPAWFADTYIDSGIVDTEAVWNGIEQSVEAARDNGTIPTYPSVIVMYMLKDEFGGYCSEPAAMRAAYDRSSDIFDPWVNGGCEPGTPADVSATAGQRRLEVSWTAPEDIGGAPVTGYRVQWKKAAGSWGAPADVSVAAAASTSHVIDAGLDDGTAYTVRVLAVNSIGDGGPSAEAAAATTPGPVRELAATAGYGLLQVTWQSPAGSAASSLKHYEVSYMASGDSNYTAHTTIAPQHADSDSTVYSTDISGLVNGTEHTVRVVAVDGADTPGPASTVTGTAGRPGPVQNLQIDLRRLQLNLSWDPPANAHLFPELSQSETEDREGIYGLLYRVQWLPTGEVGSGTFSSRYVEEGTHRYNIRWAGVDHDGLQRASVTSDVNDSSWLTTGTTYTVRVTPVLIPAAAIDQQRTDLFTFSDETVEQTAVPTRFEVPDDSVLHDQVRASIGHVVESRESEWPWMRTAWDYLENQEIKVADANYTGRIVPGCDPEDQTIDMGRLAKCWVKGIIFHLDVYLDNSVENSEGNTPKYIIVEDSLFEGSVIHELGHVYTMTSDIEPDLVKRGLLGRAWLYFLTAAYDGAGSISDLNCSFEALADTFEWLVGGSSGSYDYYNSCFGSDGASDEMITEMTTVVNSALNGSNPAWFTDKYGDDASLDTTAVWDAIEKSVTDAKDNNTKRIYPSVIVMYMLKDEFGGYCSEAVAVQAAYSSSSDVFDPWVNGGCEPGAPTSVTVSAGAEVEALEVSWTAPDSPGGAPVLSYRVQWKSGDEQYDPSREVLADASAASAKIVGLTGGTEHTVRVLAVNSIGDGDSSDEATGTPTRSYVPQSVAAFGRTGQIEVWWHPSDGGSEIAAYKVQWKSGTEQYDSSREATLTIGPPVEGDTWLHTITGLTNGTEHSVRVQSVDASDAIRGSVEVSATPMAFDAALMDFIKDSVVDAYPGEPWLEVAYDHLVDENIPVTVDHSVSRASGTVKRNCDRIRDSLHECIVADIVVSGGLSMQVDGLAHELAHVYTVANHVVDYSAPIGLAFVYMGYKNPWTPQGGFWECDTRELMADAMEFFVSGTVDSLFYWNNTCHTTHGLGPTETDQAVFRAAINGTIPEWFVTEFDGDPERLWREVQDTPGESPRLLLTTHLKDLFGGYCSAPVAVASALGESEVTNPWRLGVNGCEHQSPAAVGGDGQITVSWSAPGDDGPFDITGYRVQWKSGAEEYDPSRQSGDLAPTAMSHVIGSLEADTEYTVRVVAFNAKGEIVSFGDVTASTTVLP